jgi:hypothetical protein
VNYCMRCGTRIMPGHFFCSVECLQRFGPGMGNKGPAARNTEGCQIHGKSWAAMNVQPRPFTEDADAPTPDASR